LRVSEAVSPLIKLVEDVDREVQEAAIWALGQIGGRRARRVLESCAQSEDETLQAAAEDALAELDLGSVPLPLLTYEVQEEESAGSEGDEESEDGEETEDEEEVDFQDERDDDAGEDWA